LATLGLLLSVCACGGGDDDDAKGAGANATHAGTGGKGGGGMSAAATGTGGKGGAMGTAGMGTAGMGVSGTGSVSAGADGQVVAPWDKYCVATFTKDFDVLDSFGDVALSVHKGDRYLLGTPGSFAAGTLIYIADAGPAAIDMNYDTTAPPFTSSCTGATQSMVGVFVDTTVYSDEMLKTPVCTLQAGLAVPSAGVNFAITGGDLLSASVYNVELNELAQHCKGTTSGYVEGVSVEAGSTSYGGPPIESFLGPQ
jgi:hypothetical protein